MASRTAKVASSIVAGILAGIPVTAPGNAANAADAAECLTTPGKNAPQGQHWYYRLEHGTKRHCWYTRGASAAAAQTAPANAPAPAAEAASQAGDNPSHSLEDARAEYPMPQTGGTTTAAPAPDPTPLASAPAAAAPPADPQGSAVASRWPSPQSDAAPQAAAPQAPADATVSASAPAADADVDVPADTGAEATAPAAEKPSASLQMLLAVVGGALALAGLTASVVYRLGRKRQRRLDTRERRAVLWEGVDTAPRPPWVEPGRVETVPDPQPLRAAERAPRTQQRHEKIEELLAQLVRQGQQSDA